jgi:N-acetylglucosamine repressor
VVDAERGISRQQPFFDWIDVPLGEMLTQRLGVSVHIDNDVNALTLAERLYGAGQEVDDFLTVTVGRGVGLGVVIGGQLYRGALGGGGEFGHIVMEADGPQCDCGKRGCLEAFVGERALLREANEAARRGELPLIHTVDELIRSGQDGNPIARRIFAHAGEVLGRGIATLNNLFNPRLILLSGEGVSAGEMLFEPMRTSIQIHTMPALRKDTEIRIDPLGDDAWARGAASLVLKGLFESPMHKGVVE